MKIVIVTSKIKQKPKTILGRNLVLDVIIYFVTAFII